MIVKCLRHQVPFLKTFSRSELTQPALRLAKYVFLQINKTTSHVIASPHHKIDSVRGILSDFNHHDQDFLSASSSSSGFCIFVFSCCSWRSSQFFKLLTFARAYSLKSFKLFLLGKLDKRFICSTVYLESFDFSTPRYITQCLKILKKVSHQNFHIYLWKISSPDQCFRMGHF